ncbi:Hypothetical Protein FCC1311_069372 [Hondaea fermentalgiana]|uniref:SGNH hydrolase-type esterase domain-containing protein n=1 Tax=Hondaea fermentalgiana TaxID=2315210 RepID=A0A2R5GIJ8_9STRA|nr:Hypothetical Protein FCC1311_069372 [Hondaea fermentalgiana]|eukprot:GBG30717.1 Hypothetical Protein FCC1311_069372 [Hondaea fermentalgiana]
MMRERVVTFALLVLAFDAYGYRVEELLNSRYPCKGKYVVKNRSNADFVIVEASANDIADISQKAFVDRSGTSNLATFWTEGLMRHIRRNFPHLGMMWLEMATRNWIGHWKDGKKGGLRLPPYRLDAAEDHLHVLRYYDLPQLDILHMIGPGWSQDDWNFRDGCYFTDPVHPTRYGHNISASVIMYALDGMLQRAAARDLAMYVEAKFLESIDFDRNETYDRLVKSNENWYFGTDVQTKPSTFMTTSHSSCLNIDLQFDGRVSLLAVSLLHTYQGVGTARVGLTERCIATSDEFVQIGKEEVFDCLWGERASETQMHILSHDFSAVGRSGCAKYLRVCSSDDPGRAAKLKLFSTSFVRKV